MSGVSNILLEQLSMEGAPTSLHSPSQYYRRLDVWRRSAL